MLKKILPAAVVSFALAYGLPVSSGSAQLAGAAFVASTILLSVVYARALKRHDALAEWVAIELNKLRRVYHLAKNLGGERHRQWFTELHGYIYGYLASFDKRDFTKYQESNGDFRKLSYHLYTIPELATEKERVLYRELLDAAGTVASSRQRIQDLWNGGLSGAWWSLIMVMHALSAAAILFAMGPADRLMAAILLTFGALAMALVRDADAMRTFSAASLSKRYVENIARLELRRHE